MANKTPAKEDYISSLVTVVDSAYERWMIQTFCIPIQRQLPKWVHPNMITMVNFVVAWTAFAFSYCSYEFEVRHLTRFALQCRLTVAVLVFLSMVLDSLDGIHARTSKKCSDLGECLDHCLDAVNMELMAFSILFSFVPDELTFVITAVGSQAVYHAQMLIYRAHHKMVEAPTNGPEAQTMTAIGHLIIAVVLFWFDRRSSVVQWTLIGFAIFGNVIQFNNCRYYLPWMTSASINPVKPEKQVEQAQSAQPDSQLHAYGAFLATSFAYALLLGFGAVTRLEFMVIYTVLSFRSTGLLVLYAVLEKHYPKEVSNFDTSMLGRTDPLLIAWLTILGVGRMAPIYFDLSGTEWLTSRLPHIFAIHLVLLNLWHMYHALYFLDSGRYLKVIRS